MRQFTHLLQQTTPIGVAVAEHDRNPLIAKDLQRGIHLRTKMRCSPAQGRPVQSAETVRKLRPALVARADRQNTHSTYPIDHLEQKDPKSQPSSKNIMR